MSKTGKIKVVVYEKGASESKSAELDLDLLAAIREGSADYKDRLEERLVEMLDAASENPGFGWSVAGGDEAALIKP